MVLLVAAAVLGLEVVEVLIAVVEVELVACGCHAVALPLACASASASSISDHLPILTASVTPTNEGHQKPSSQGRQAAATPGCASPQARLL